MIKRYFFSTLLLILMTVMGCGAPKHIRVKQHKTTPVTGIVHVDGEPAMALTVECHPATDSQAVKHPVVAMTDQNGKFAFGMYDSGDGMPEGEYNLAFVWDANMANTDKLKKAYADPKKTEHKVTVTTGTPVDMGIIELTTKK